MSVIEAFGFPFAGGKAASPRGLTASQRETVTSILSGFDGDKLTTSQEASIRDAGIRPSRELALAIKAEGFDPDTLKPGGRPATQPAGEPAGKLDIDLDALRRFAEVLEGYDPGSTSDERLSQLVERLREAGLTRSGSVFDIKV